MYQQVINPNQNAVITPSRLAAFGNFDLPQQYVTDSSPAVLTDDYALLLTWIAAATEQVENMAQWSILTEQIIETADFFPNTKDPRDWFQNQLGYSYSVVPWNFFGYPQKDSIELTRRPVQVPAYTGNAVAVTAASVASNVVTVTTTLNPTVGSVVILNGTAEGNVNSPSQTPSTTPFLNGVPLTVKTASGTQFTATFNNFYTLVNNVVTPSSYTNNADTGTAQVWSNPCVITYNDANGVLNTWSTINYTVAYDKITLTISNWWPVTDRRQDCIQVAYFGGDLATSPTPTQHARLQQAVLYLANQMVQVRDYISVEPTSEIYGTLCLMLSSYRSTRIPK